MEGGGIGEGDPGSQGSFSHVPGKRVNLCDLCILRFLVHTASCLVASIKHLRDRKVRNDSLGITIILIYRLTCFSSPELNWNDPDMWSRGSFARRHNLQRMNIKECFWERVGTWQGMITNVFGGMFLRDDVQIQIRCDDAHFRASNWC